MEDDEVQLIKQVVNLEPILIDLTESDDEPQPPTSQPSPQSPQSPQQPQSQPHDSTFNRPRVIPTFVTSNGNIFGHKSTQQTSFSDPLRFHIHRQEQFGQPQAPECQETREEPHSANREPPLSPSPSPPPSPEQPQPPTRNNQQQQYVHQQSEAEPTVDNESMAQEIPGLEKSKPNLFNEHYKRPHSSNSEETGGDSLAANNNSLPDPPIGKQQSHVHQPKKPQMSDHELMMAQKALGNEKYKHNLFDDAIRTYKRANELAKKLGNTEMSAILHFNLAMTYYKLGSYEQAADECANAVKINDNYLKAHLKRAEIYQRQCKFEEAVICYEHICELDSNNQDYAVLLNYAKEAAKKTKKRDSLQILGLKPNFTPEDLKKAYRQQALSHHPDRHSDADIVTRRIEEKQFKDASEAHTFIQLRYGYRR